ncbi:hypothetical protein FisN_17Lu018 [Fistulifera solaris]|uniref:Uncharacterized protein n=1 Tax=Fistulifera solaris TaxID=1519565 RepID=A0A1Z5J5K9_FISSO|nr:hypothetical protein FisN_17Lu018 [Fistulifera solaris]|eukprot:GAX09273.1 hypothetical protein FisN_17Lu018 [Fistulifera solaris]
MKSSIVFYSVLACLGWNPAFSFAPTCHTKLSSRSDYHDNFQRDAFRQKHERIDSTLLFMAETNTEGRKLPFWLDPGTKGGVVFLSFVLFLVPLLAYNVATNVFGADEIETGITIGVGFTVFATVAWVSTYIFRVATKDMTYAKQLKDYEDAVIAKRLEELDEDEVKALQEEIERDDF